MKYYIFVLVFLSLLYWAMFLFHYEKKIDEVCVVSNTPYVCSSSTLGIIDDNDVLKTISKSERALKQLKKYKIKFLKEKLLLK